MTSDEAIIILPLPKPASAKRLRKWRARAAAKARQAASVVMVAVQAVDAAATSGAAVPIPAVRQAATMPAWQFDAAVAQLVLDRRVYVHRHDLPSSLPDATQRACYWDDGRCYCGMSLAARWAVHCPKRLERLAALGLIAVEQVNGQRIWSI